MCGIVGFTAEYLDPTSARQTAKAMAELIRHRGPDGEGYYADTRAALGHRRLSIIDVNGGGQPMFNEEGAPRRIWFVMRQCGYARKLQGQRQRLEKG